MVQSGQSICLGSNPFTLVWPIVRKILSSSLKFFKVLEPFIQAGSDLNSSYFGSKIISSTEMVQTYESDILPMPQLLRYLKKGPGKGILLSSDSTFQNRIQLKTGRSLCQSSSN